MFSCGGALTRDQKTLAEQASKATFSLFTYFYKFSHISPIVKYEFFEKMIIPILRYGCEVWGFHQGPDVERVHLQFMKRIIVVKKSTQNDFVYGEFGKIPLINRRKVQILKYWLKIVQGEKPLYVNISYHVLYEQVVNRVNCVNWVSQIRDMLFHLGFGEVWYNQGVGDADSFIYLFKQRINDIFSQNWRSSLEDSTRARTHKLLRTDFVTRKYLETVNCASHLTAFARLVTSSHRLRVETGRWDKPVAIEYKDRKCQLCNPGDIEDEYHFVLKYPVYSSIRRRCIPRRYWYRPNMMKFQNLFSNKCAHVIKALAKYTYLAFRRRDEFLMQQRNL